MTRQRPRVPPRLGRATALLGVAVVLGALGGCVTSGPRATGSSLNPDVVSMDEIERSSAANAYDLVQQVRPNWLRGRGTPSFQRRQAQLPVVYLADRAQGPLDVLRSFATASVAELRYINATTATTRYGEGHGGGIIEVVLRRR